MSDDQIKERWNWEFGFGEETIIKDKPRLIKSYIAYMLNRTQEMFKWSGLPETIPYRELERILQTYGKAFIVRKDNELYAVYGTFGGELNEYYFPKDAIIANPWLNYTKTDKIGDDCEMVRNDFLMLGLIPMASRYASLLAEVDISMRIGAINSRLMKLIEADNDTAKASADEYMKAVIEGSDPSVIAGNAFFNNIKVENANNTGAVNQLKELIEMRQYLTSQWFIELGLNSNFNMKREAINSAESGMNDDILLPFVDQMLRERREACERINKMYGTNISVEFDSSWKDVHQAYHAKTDGLEPKEDEEIKEDAKESEVHDDAENKAERDE